MSKAFLNEMRAGRRPKIISNEVSTPLELFLFYHALYNFTLDAAASHKNHKVMPYYTLRKNALIRRWRGRVWCNPPYDDLYNWVKKAHEEALRGAIVVMLLPNRTGTAWFQEFVLPFANVEFLPGRVKFTGPGLKHEPSFYSIVATFPRCKVRHPKA